MYIKTKRYHNNKKRKKLNQKHAGAFSLYAKLDIPFNAIQQ